MNKWTALLLLTILFAAACDDPKSPKRDLPRLQGVWDFNLTPTPAPDEEFTVAVEIPGGSNAARVSILGPGVADAETVIADNPLAVGDCGVTITFGDTTGFYLAGGDFWTIEVRNQRIGPALPGNSVDSVTSGVFSGGTYSCLAVYCDGSALGSAVPFPTKGIGQAEREGGQWLTARLRQDEARITAQVPEQHALSLFAGTVVNPSSTPPVFLPPLFPPGEAVTLSYRRAVSADGENGDFLRVLVTNGAEYLEVEHLEREGIASGDTTVSFTFIAGSEVQIDFMAGLSEPGEFAVLDEVRLSTSGGVVFEEDFESGPVCSPDWGAGSRWELRSPRRRVGEFCLSANGALAGSYSARWNGGSYRELSGSIISAASAQGILSLAGLGAGGADLSALSGILFTVWEPVWTKYFTSFSAAQQAPGSLVGTFKGESRDHVCIEEGQFTAAQSRSSELDLSESFLVMRIDGSGIECSPALAAGDTLMFGDTITTATGDTIAVIQLGGFFMAVEDLIDDHGNAYEMSGVITGSLVTFALEEASGIAAANGLGALAGDQIVGALTGRMVFDVGRVCELYETTFVIDLVEK